MNNNISVGVGFLIPVAAIVAFVFFVFSENFLMGLFIAIAGVLAWFLYSTVMQSDMPDVTGNVIIVFGFLISLAVFLNYGWDRNIFGGYEFNAEGAAGAALLLFLNILLGVLFKKSPAGPIVRTSKQAPQSSDLSVAPQHDTTVAAKKDPLELDPFDPDDYEGYQDYQDYYAEYYDDGEESEPEE
jgi:hypothetical protein